MMIVWKAHPRQYNTIQVPLFNESKA